MVGAGLNLERWDVEGQKKGKMRRRRSTLDKLKIGGVCEVGCLRRNEERPSEGKKKLGSKKRKRTYQRVSNRGKVTPFAFET